ncbi:hypothetical protein EST38_g20 [Candolleomyces aberdarensis]|uniref:Uncharacterized protein n=1 Tax=Candolleomyces aberdarensis TaxID=2316362 RepID=A0A4Q2E0A5_9AGAR|nr:hypothetical protein EST38_g20 [Candolleomyces aberdarensis]
MGSLHIREGSPRETEEELKATLRGRRRSQAPTIQASDSLRSLSTTSNEIVGILLKPGVLDDDTEPEDNIAPKFKPLSRGNTRIIQWQETVQLPANPNANLALTRPKSSPQSHMPGTLYTPNPSFFESQTSIVKQEVGPEIIFTSPTPSYTSDSPPPSKTKPLARTMSTEQREFFLSQIGSASKAMIHVLPKAHVLDIAEEARDMGLLADIVMNDDEEDSQALLVVGKNDAEVDKLLARVQLAGQGKLQEKLEKKSAPSSTSGSTFKAVAGGAVVGAVSTWAGLAFS